MKKPRVETKILEVETQSDYDYLMENFKSSNQPLHVREEFIHKLKKTYPQYDNCDRLPTRELRQMIKEGEADIKDLQGFD